MLRQLDFTMETGYRNASRGEQWSNLVPLTGIDLKPISTLAVALYDASGMSSINGHHDGLTDWNGQRLLVSLGADDLHRNGAIMQARQASYAALFATELQASDVLGDWVAGDGVGRIAGSSAALSLTTETGLGGTGAIHADRIDVPGWGVSGRLTADHRRIVWSNGFIWHRAVNPVAPVASAARVQR